MRKKKGLIVAAFVIILTCIVAYGIVNFYLPSSKPNKAEKPLIDFQNLPRMVLTYYYPWYGTPWGPTGWWRHWDEAGHFPSKFIDSRRDIAATDYPINGPYDSKNRSLIAWHFRLAESACIDGFIVSWWGFESFEDQAFQLMLDVAEEIDTTVKLTIYYEMTPGRSISATALELERILKEYGGRKAFLKVQGYPVIFIYARAIGQLSPGEWADVLKRIREDGYNGLFIGDGLYVIWAEVFDGIHTYFPLEIFAQGEDLIEVYSRAHDIAHKRRIIFAATVLPGYDDTNIRKPGLVCPREHGKTYNQTWEVSMKSKANWVLITSWNEWHEGSEIEPSVEYGDYYVKLTRQHADRFKESSK